MIIFHTKSKTPNSSDISRINLTSFVNNLKPHFPIVDVSPMQICDPNQKWTKNRHCNVSLYIDVILFSSVK